eukprot:5352081-Alexandrium_andersonii.AAC.1
MAKGAPPAWGKLRLAHCASTGSRFVAITSPTAQSGCLRRNRWGDVIVAKRRHQQHHCRRHQHQPEQEP